MMALNVVHGLIFAIVVIIIYYKAASKETFVDVYGYDYENGYVDLLPPYFNSCMDTLLGGIQCFTPMNNPYLFPFYFD